MADQFGFTEGVKSLSSSLNATREGTKELTKTIEAIQGDATEVAQKKAIERRKTQHYQPDNTVIKAYNEYQMIQEVKKMELRMKAEVVNKYGSKAWDDIQSIKQRMLKEEMQNKKLFDNDLKAVQRVQFYCYAVAAMIAWYLTWGYK